MEKWDVSDNTSEFYSSQQLIYYIDFIKTTTKKTLICISQRLLSSHTARHAGKQTLLMKKKPQKIDRGVLSSKQQDSSVSIVHCCSEFSLIFGWCSVPWSGCFILRQLLKKGSLVQMLNSSTAMLPSSAFTSHKFWCIWTL